MKLILIRRDPRGHDARCARVVVFVDFFVIRAGQDGELPDLPAGRCDSRPQRRLLRLIAAANRWEFTTTVRAGAVGQPTSARSSQVP